MTTVVARDTFGAVLRDWRNRRHRSQLALATEAGVSQRHISFLETGRSKPSREMVVHLGVVLDIPLRDRNGMLMAAGFAPVYAERSIDDPDLDHIRQALETMLRAHDPFPAYLIDRHWNLLLANDASLRLLAGLPASVQAVAGNMLHLMLHPDGLRTVSDNWADAAAATIRRVEQEVAENPADEKLAELLAEALATPGAPDARSLARVPAQHDVLIPVTVDRQGVALSFFTTIATLGSPVDVTLAELRLETLLPADPETEAVLRALADDAA